MMKYLALICMVGFMISCKSHNPASHSQSDGQYAAIESCDTDAFQDFKSRIDQLNAEITKIDYEQDYFTWRYRRAVHLVSILADDLNIYLVQNEDMACSEIRNLQEEVNRLRLRASKL